MIAVDKVSRRNQYAAIIGRARAVTEAHGNSFFMVRGLIPVRHVEIPERDLEWATLDP